MRKFFPATRAITACAAILFAGHGMAAEFEPVEISIGLYRIQAELARTPEAREQGLMFRKSMPAGRGMLFAFPQSGYICMWMKNTDIPLSAAFMDASGTIINIEDMQPQTEANHCGAKATAYVLEMNAGWFKQHRIGPGQRISGLETLPRAR
ncbi:MAG: DUF192 domain-containing protein [Rhodocyclaceae bacterium]|nr:DUF192 domain-containing protein [Rhodocyclaceae bacterium]MBX3667076.1 DUF192 domain-containing protein [Rhodocyclaceae bacterium]